MDDDSWDEPPPYQDEDDARKEATSRLMRLAFMKGCLFGAKNVASIKDALRDGGSIKDLIGGGYAEYLDWLEKMLDIEEDEEWS